MRLPAMALVLWGVVALGGCGAQRVLLGSDSPHLLTVSDALAVPGEQVELRSRLQLGDLLRDQSGCVIRYRWNDVMKVAETDCQGQAVVHFQPPREGDYLVDVEVAPVGLRQTPDRRQLRVTCRQAQEPLVIVDLDRTVVASGFHAVLVGDPEPMANSAEVLKGLAVGQTVVYLTHRPSYFEPKTKDWLARHGYPPGPVLLSTTREFLSGSLEFKVQALTELRQRFPRIGVGIGDKVTDVLAYHQVGARGFLILTFDPDASADDLDRLAIRISQLPPEVQVVRDWTEVNAALQTGQTFPPQRSAGYLRDLAHARRVEKMSQDGQLPAQVLQEAQQ